MKTLAVIVSFNSQNDISNAINSVKEQVDEILIVDNKSQDNSLAELTKLQEQENINVQLLPENMGIATAINIGIDKAIKENFDYLLTLDQDSVCAPDLVSTYASFINLKGSEFNIGVLCSNIIAPEQQVPIKTNNIVLRDYAISSGCLFPVSVLENVGMQKDDYFIDAVDFEYSLRLRDMGYSIIKCNDAILFHKLGVKQNVSIGPIKLRITVHTAFRRYFMYRNQIFLMKDYWHKFPLFILKRFYFLTVFIFQIILFEKNKRDNLLNCFKGLYHGFINKKGKYPYA